MNVVAYDPYVSRGAEIAVGVDRVESLEDLLAVSDVVSLHCPLTDETRDMINATTLAQMKRDAILINTARGAIVDIPALIDALRNGDLAGAGIDVLPVEPPPADDILAIAYRGRADPMVGERLMVTPHAAWSSPESVSDARRLAVETAMFYLREGKLRNLVNSRRAMQGARRGVTGTMPEARHDFIIVGAGTRRLHARQPADRVGPPFRAAARGRRPRQLDLVPHSRRLPLRDGQSTRRLVLSHGADPGPQRPCARLSTRDA